MPATEASPPSRPSAAGPHRTDGSLLAAGPLRTGGPVRRIGVAGLLLLLAWTAAGFAVEVARFDRRLDERVGSAEGWRLDSPDAAGVGHFVASVDPEIPAGSLVAFAPAVNLPAEEHFISLWAAYHLPRQRVIRYGHYATGAADWVIGYRRAVDDPRFELVRRLPSGTLYRRR